MAGILDFLNSDDAKLGIALMAAAGPSMQPMGFGQRLQGAMQSLDADKQNQLKTGLMKAQMDNFASEAETRKAALAKQQQLLAMFGGGPVGGAPSANLQASGLPQAANFAPGGNAMKLPYMEGAAPPQSMLAQGAGAQPQPGQSRVGSLTPDQLVQAKMLGLDLTDVYKLTLPDMQVSNGYAYDKKNVKPGFLPGVNIANDGRGTITMPGADGLPRMAPMPGSVEAYGNFEDRKNASAAGTELVKVVGPDGAERYVPKAQVLGAPQPAAQPRAGRVDLSAGDADRFAILSQELERARAAGNKGDVAAVTAEINRLPASARTGSNPSGLSVPGFQATPTTAQANKAAADKVAAEQIAKDVAEQRKGIMSAGFNAPSNIARYQQIGKLLQDVDGGTLTASGTHLASLANSLGVKIDKNLPNKEAAASLANAAALELRNPAGGAGMPGAMSDQDRAFLQSMTPNMSQSAQGRKQVIDSYIAVQTRNQQVADFARKYEAKYGKLDNGFFDQLSQWSNANPLFKAK
jgi:hypothetical protein